MRGFGACGYLRGLHAANRIIGTCGAKYAKEPAERPFMNPSRLQRLTATYGSTLIVDQPAMCAAGEMTSGDWHLRPNLLSASLAWSFLLVLVVNLVLVAVAGTFPGYIEWLLFPGEWTVYANLDVSIHNDLWALVLAELIDVLVYWPLIALLLSLLWRRRGQTGPGGLATDNRLASDSKRGEA